MKLAYVKLKGFRNFKKAKIKFNHKTLIIGSNDVGKTNLLWAIRLLLDRSLSDYDIEPKDSDFYAYEETNEFEIQLSFSEVTDDCVVSRMKGKISDKDNLVLIYKGYRDRETKAKSFKLYAGPTEGEVEEIDDRYYRKVLNVKYISSRRDFHSYINREKNNLFQTAQENRTERETTSDNKLYSEIQTDLRRVDEKIPKLNFISSATDLINEELGKLSIHHQNQKIVFDASTSNIDSFIKNVSIASKNKDQNVLIGGDGRLNQIYLALWASRNELAEESLSEVTIFCIEEPEAHLHPHQQRKLSEYLNSSLSGQVILTTHSPQIASEFSPNSIVRLLNDRNATKAASGGCSQIIDEAIQDFGYRMSIIPAEAFFADVVLLIEGPSEELFFRTLAKQLNIDLDRLNISVLMVDGVGFTTFIKVLTSLEIKWVLRTDNDIFKTPRKSEFRFAGVERVIKYYKTFCESDETTEEILKAHEENLKWPDEPTPKRANRSSAASIIKDLAKFGIYLSVIDLENDLCSSELYTPLSKFFKIEDKSELIEAMQKRKAIGIYNFLKEQKESLKVLDGDLVARPLLHCKELIEYIQNEAK